MIALLLVSFIVQDVPSKSLRYLRPTKDKYELESEVRETKLKDSFVYQSVTHRPNAKLDLKIYFDKKKRITSAEILYTTTTGKHKARAFIDKAQIIRRVGGKKVIQAMTFPTRPMVVTSAPDWSDIILLLRQYDQKKGGKQSFKGLWFHPNKKAHVRTFVVEKVGRQTLPTEKKTEVGQFRVTLRSGAYLVWADRNGRVLRLRKPKQKAAIVLEGYEKLTKGW